MTNTLNFRKITEEDWPLEAYGDFDHSLADLTPRKLEFLFRLRFHLRLNLHAGKGDPKE